ncbi:MAG TPA: hypothetical protein VEO01_06905 [Pseudonocardiaceae bacterium]|nr:hypothetical protein [Pseudonocardiaceae bacterium]
MKVDLVAGITPVSVGSVEQTAHELTELIIACRGADPDAAGSARAVAEIAHRSSASLVAVVRHPAADPALLFGVLVAGNAFPESGSDIREVVEGRSPLGYPVVFAERVVTEAQLRAGEPFDCQLQAVVTDPAGGRLAVFTLSSSTGRGWLELSGVFGRLVASVDFG